jgi:hypothetical protein
MKMPTRRPQMALMMATLPLLWMLPPPWWQMMIF